MTEQSDSENANRPIFRGAGERVRTVDIQLGKVDEGCEMIERNTESPAFRGAERCRSVQGGSLKVAFLVAWIGGLAALATPDASPED